ncbi:hypothetical protein R9X49_21900 [Pectobacterium carotovorum]|uniref:hypothetical protein n=1 Tax=Pectobacterium carotovorum TaxID=554 RepID=UPI0029DD2468|nr:hypothetical protein [Pectobacterium carotovorum]MDX6917752.1 hypothetical protein [Pectobacterium carotovorum]
MRPLAPALTPVCRARRLTPPRHCRRAAAEPAVMPHFAFACSFVPLYLGGRSHAHRLCAASPALRYGFVAIPDFCAVCLPVVRHG